MTNSLYLSILYGTFLSIIITLSWIDVLTHTIPIPLLVVLIPITLLLAQTFDQISHIFSLLLVLVPFGACYILFPNQIGVGDIIFMVVISLML